MSQLTPLLIVEDDPDIRELVAHHLASVVDCVMFARDGVEALEIISSRPVCGIVSDLRMPGMDGIQLLQSVRSLNLDIPFILVTGHAEAGALIQAVRLQVADVIEKPYVAERLRVSVAKALKGSQA